VLIIFGQFLFVMQFALLSFCLCRALVGQLDLGFWPERGRARAVLCLAWLALLLCRSVEYRRDYCAIS
jgi:hypothetical protein